MNNILVFLLSSSCKPFLITTAILLAVVVFVNHTIWAVGFEGDIDNLDINITRQEHTIHFPEKIVFNLEGFTQEDVIQITLRYRILGSKVSSYTYSGFNINPTDGKFLSTAEVKTSGSHYIPSGIEIEYYFHVTTSDDVLFETDKFIFSYLNPEYKWQSMTSDYLTVFWHDILEEDVRDSVEKTQILLKDVVEITDLKTITSFRAVVVNNTREALETFPRISRTATRNRLYGGFAFKDYDVFIIGGIGIDGLVHEGTHMLVSQAIHSPLATIPAWLNEGLAMYFESSDRGRDNTVEQALIKGQLKPLNTMSTVPGHPQDVRIFYAHSQAITKYLINNHGQEKMSDLLKQINEGHSIEQSINSTYGMSLADLHQKWKKSIAPTFERKLIIDPGTFWTSTLLGAVFIFALCSLSVGWIKRKMNPHPDVTEQFHDEIYWK